MNFKGVQQSDYFFQGDTNICGRNGSGKSTIYEGYLWCLFGKNPFGGVSNVQPLDGANQVVHNLVTEATAVISLDGMRMKVTRKLAEDWVKPRGTTQVILKGTTQTRFINDVPMSVSEFNDKLSEIFNMDEWFMLSSINILPGMNQAERRERLQRIAPEFDEVAMMTKYPAIMEAHLNGKSIVELARQNKISKDDAKKELDEIPARIDQQELLRVNEDWSALESEQKRLQAELDDKESQLSSIQFAGSATDNVAKVQKLQNALSACTSRAMDLSRKAEREQANKEAEARAERQRLENEIKLIEDAINTNTRRKNAAQAVIDAKKAEVNKLLGEWKAENDREYVEQPVTTVCPTCGQNLPEAQIESAKRKLHEHWKESRAKAMDDIRAKGAAARKEMDEQTKLMNEVQQQIDADRVKIEDLHTKISAAMAYANVIASASSILAGSREYQDAIKEKEAAQKALDEFKDSLQAQDATAHDDANALRGEIDGIRRDIKAVEDKLAGKRTNERIDTLKAELKERESNLAQAVADCERVEAQIAAFKKERIEKVEAGVSSLFRMIHWKMYEPNITNDGEKEICQAIIDGVPYEQQNTATKFNAAVDMVNGFMVAHDISLPLFIDNKESVSNLIDTQAQVITLAVNSDYSTVRFNYKD